MAITTNSLRILLKYSPSLRDLGHVVTVGRLGMYAPEHLLRSTVVEQTASGSSASSNTRSSYAWFDDFLRACNVPQVDVLDGSAYEGATTVHDLNQPVPAALHNRFDTLIDGGTLEHVFNVPTALDSYMRMLKVGGRVFLFDMPLTGLSGHGFYQFSPILFSEAFCERHGFELESLVACEDRPFATIRDVRSSVEGGGRTEIVHPWPSHLHIVARKLTPDAGLNTFPIQPDYKSTWQRQDAAPKRPREKLAGALLRAAAPGVYFKLTHLRDQRRQRRSKLLRRFRILRDFG
jgi:hypothetical protein